MVPVLLIVIIQTSSENAKNMSNTRFDLRIDGLFVKKKVTKPHIHSILAKFSVLENPVKVKYFEHYFMH